MKLFNEKEPKLRSKINWKRARHHSSKLIKKLRNKSFRMKVKSDDNTSSRDLKRNRGHEF